MTEDQKRAKIIEKIQKLLALSTSPNEAEAMSAMRMAQQLMMQYQIAQDEITLNDEAAGEAITKEMIESRSKKEIWRGALASAIAETNFCDMYWLNKGDGSGNIIILGTPSNIVLVKAMYEYLTSTIERLAKEGCKTEKSNYKVYRQQIAGTDIIPYPEPKWSQWATSFREGCKDRIIGRLWEQRRHMEEHGIQTPAEPATSNSPATDDVPLMPVTALACRSAYDQAEKAIESFKKQQGLVLRQGRRTTRRVTTDGYSAGRRAGDRVSLNRQVGGSSGSGRAALR